MTTTESTTKEIYVVGKWIECPRCGSVGSDQFSFNMITTNKQLAKDTAEEHNLTAYIIEDGEKFVTFFEELKDD